MNESKYHEYRNNNSNGNTTTVTSNGGPIVMDEVNFKYLKHVIVKFLTSREVSVDKKYSKSPYIILRIKPLKFQIFISSNFYFIKKKKNYKNIKLFLFF